MFLAAILILWGCNSLPAGSETVQPPAEEVKAAQEEGIGSLPCFKCHPYEKYTSSFPHTLHSDMGLHCTECHILKTHNEITLNKKICGSCHQG
jgi:hypothetical protein